MKRGIYLALFIFIIISITTISSFNFQNITSEQRKDFNFGGSETTITFSGNLTNFSEMQDSNTGNIAPNNGEGLTWDSSIAKWVATILDGDLIWGRAGGIIFPLNTSNLNMGVGNITANWIIPNEVTVFDDHNNTILLTSTGEVTLHAMDDAMLHHTNLSISAVGGVVNATIFNEQYPGSEIQYVVNHTFYEIADGSTVELTKGTWVSPQTNYIYVDENEVLIASTSPPSGEFAWAGIVEVANSTGTDVQYYAIQDDVPTAYETFKHTYERAWYDNPIYETGISISFEGNNLTTTNGSMRFALNSVPYTARNVTSGTKLMWVSDPTSAFSLHDTLDSIANYQDGGAIGNTKYFNVVIFGLVEDEVNGQYYYFNVQDEPTLEYNSISGAETDVYGKTNYQCPVNFARTCFPIARVVLKRNTGAGTNVIQTLANGLTFIQLLDQNLIIFGGTSAVALGLDEVLKNNPNTVENIISTANLTLGQKITFTFGEIIDNIVDGWIRVTGSLNVTGNVTSAYFIGDGSQLTGISTSSDSWNKSGSDVFLHHPTDKVGIGTSSPTHKLEVIGNINALKLSDSLTDTTTKQAKITLAHYDTDEEDIMIFYPFSTSTENNLWVGGGSASQNALTNIVFATGGTTTTTSGVERMRIDESGNVGIGTTSPQAITDFTTSGQAKGTVTKSTYGYWGKTNEASGWAAMQVYNFGNAAQSGRSWGFQTLESPTTTTGNINFQVLGGNVGVGIEIPARKFVVKKTGASSDIEIISDSNKQSQIWFTHGATTQWYLSSRGSGNANKLFLYENDGSTVIQTWDQDGNVGIGTISPSDPLHILSSTGEGLRIESGTTDSKIELGGTNYEWQIYRDYTGGPTGGDFVIDYIQGSGTTLTIDRSGYPLWAATQASTGGTALCWDGSGASYWGTCTSLTELKTNINNLSMTENIWDKYMKLNPVSYFWKDENWTQDIQVGFLAENVEDVHPSLAQYTDGNLTGVKYDSITATNVMAIQDLKEENDLMKIALCELGREEFCV